MSLSQIPLIRQEFFKGQAGANLVESMECVKMWLKGKSFSGFFWFGMLCFPGLYFNSYNQTETCLVTRIFSFCYAIFISYVKYRISSEHILHTIQLTDYLISVLQLENTNN
jgi:hypothetical protein